MTDTRDWPDLGRKLGMSVAVVSETSMLGWSFPSFRREVAEPITPDPKTSPWLYGTRDGVATIVRPAVMELPPLPPPPFQKAFAHIFPPRREGLFTMAIAEITPPLFAGVRMASAGSWRFGPAVQETLVSIEPTRLHRAFWSYASNAPRLRRLLEKQGPSDDFAEVLAAVAERIPIAIQDGVVEVFLPGGVRDLSVVSGELDAAVAIAKELSRRSAELEELPSVTAAKGKWADVATSRGLQFDPVCWHAFGRIRGVAFEVHLEPSEGFVRTTVRALFRKPRGAALEVSRSRMGSSFFGLFEKASKSPVETGDPAFDAAFQTDALDPARARGVFGDAVRQQLAKAARENTYLSMNDAEVLLAQERCVAPNELATMIDDALAIVDAATPGS